MLECKRCRVSDDAEDLQTECFQDSEHKCNRESDDDEDDIQDRHLGLASKSGGVMIVVGC